MHLIPQSWSHLHILIGVFPSVGLIFVLGFYIAGLATKKDRIIFWLYSLQDAF